MTLYGIAPRSLGVSKGLLDTKEARRELIFDESSRGY